MSGNAIENDNSCELTKGRLRRDTENSESITGIFRAKRPQQQDTRLKNTILSFAVNRSLLHELVESIDKERKLGLELHLSRQRNENDDRTSSFLMLDTFVPGMPDRNAKKVVYGLDIGGSTIRVVRLDLHGDGKITKDQTINPQPHPRESETSILSACATAADLFDYIAGQLRSMMIQFGDIKSADKFDLGFTFSFPCEIKSLDHAILTRWTKEWETGRSTSDPVEKRDVCYLLRRSLEKLNVPANLRAFANDTVGCMISCDYQKPTNTPPCLMAVIIGTGFNVCYWEPESFEYGYKSKIINVEAGGYDKPVPLTRFDSSVDWATDCRGHHPLEKCCSGAYIGEIARFAIIGVFEARAPEGAWVSQSFPAESVMACSADKSSDCRITAAVIKHCWDEEMGIDDLDDIRQICLLVVQRSAALVAAVVSAFSRATGALETGITIGIDGSLYLKNLHYQELIRNYLEECLGERSKNIVFCPSTDGSGQGTALLAA